MRNAAGIPLRSGSSIITFIFTLLIILLTCGSWVSGQTLRLNSYAEAQTNYLFASNNLTEQLKHRGQFTTPKNKLKSCYSHHHEIISCSFKQSWCIDSSPFPTEKPVFGGWGWYTKIEIITEIYLLACSREWRSVSALCKHGSISAM